MLDSGVMGDGVGEQTTIKSKTEAWAERIAAQQRSGISVKQFCRERALTEYSFYAWRKRLRKSSQCALRWWNDQGNGRRRRQRRFWSWC